MQIQKKSSKNTILYARFNNNYTKSNFSSINTELERGKAFASSRGWNLTRVFVDTPNNKNIPIYYKIKDMAVCKYQKYHPPRRLLMPKRVPVYAEPEKLLNRAAFQEMISYLNENPINVLLTPKLDRLFENLTDLHEFIKDELEPRDIELQSITEDFNTRSSEGRSFLQMLDSFEEFKYSNNKKRIWN